MTRKPAYESWSDEQLLEAWKNRTDIDHLALSIEMARRNWLKDRKQECG